jgi:hypothetical protein
VKVRCRFEIRRREVIAAGKLYTGTVDNVSEKSGKSASVLTLLGVLKKGARQT